MGDSRVCRRCGSRSILRDDSSSFLTCSSCGIVHEIDELVAPIGGADGTSGNLISVGTTGIGSVLSYKDKKIFESKNEIDDILSRLGLSASISAEVSAMVDQITDGEYGRGAWFAILIGACAHVVLRKNRKPLPMADIASVVDCDLHELGRMIERVIRHLGLILPELDMVGLFKNTIQSCPCFSAVCREKIEIMLKQGEFLLQCAIKWFLTTGRRPMPVIVAVMVLVAEINHANVRMEDVAWESHANVHTSRVRYKELLEALVNVAKVLPWGNEITVKNIVENVPFVMKYMEMKSQVNQKSQGGVSFRGVSIDDVISNCLGKGLEYNVDQDELETMANRAKIDNSSLILMAEAAEIYEFSNSNDRMLTSSSTSEVKRRKPESKIGFDALPRSFINGCAAEDRRRGKIKMAKQRIGKILSRSDVNQGDFGFIENEFSEKKKRKKKEVQSFDWEDGIIETLLLHEVKEEEIAKGSYKALLGLHVFNSGIV